jgi:hypothetical protein
MQARRAEEGRSFLSKKGGGTLAGEKLFPESITLRTDPFNRLYSVLVGPKYSTDLREAGVN